MKYRHFFRKTAAIVLALTMVFSTSAAAFAGTSAVKKPVLPQISARSALVIDGDTGEILFCKNSTTKRYPYSTTKLLTALTALDYLKPTDKAFFGTKAMGAPDKTGGFVYGEYVQVKDLIYAMMLPSSNEAAVALARRTAGTEAKFAKLMNKKAKELGCKNSHFTNSYGWLNKEHYTTARDMAKITKAAMENKLIKKAAGTEMYRLQATNKQGRRWIATTNYFVAKKKYPDCGVFAGKTGTWEIDRATLVSACERNGKVLYAVVLKDGMNDRYKSTNRILNYGYKKLAYLESIKNKDKEES